MKNIDIKSVIIGVLLTTTVFFGLGAAKVHDWPQYAPDQEGLYATWTEVDEGGWFVFADVDTPNGKKIKMKKMTGGWEPFTNDADENVAPLFRRRIK